jgi:hypothetical protein
MQARTMKYEEGIPPNEVFRLTGVPDWRNTIPKSQKGKPIDFDYYTPHEQRGLPRSAREAIHQYYADRGEQVVLDNWARLSRYRELEPAGIVFQLKNGQLANIERRNLEPWQYWGVLWDVEKGNWASGVQVLEINRK